MATKQSKKEAVVKNKKETIEKLSKLIDSSTHAVEIRVGEDSIKIEPKMQESVKPLDIGIPPEETMDNTEVYDEGDIASAYERGFIQDAINRHKDKLAPESHPDFDGETCLDCGNDIPQVRLGMGKIRCVICQTKLEQRKKFYA